MTPRTRGLYQHLPLPEELPRQRQKQSLDPTLFNEIECAVYRYKAKRTGVGVEAQDVEFLRHSMGHSQGEAGQDGGA